MRVRWIIFTIIATTLFWLNVALVFSAMMNDNDPANWFNWSGFKWVFCASITVLSILATALKVL